MFSSRCILFQWYLLTIVCCFVVLTANIFFYFYNFLSLWMNQEAFIQRKGIRVVINNYPVVSSSFYLCYSMKLIQIICNIIVLLDIFFLIEHVGGLVFWTSKPCWDRVPPENGLYLLFSDAERETTISLGRIWTRMILNRL